MRSLTCRSLVPGGLLAALVVAAASSADQIGTYDASLGLLPGDICWTAVGANQAPPPTFVDGALKHGQTSYGTSSYFSRALPPYLFADGAAVTAVVKIQSSTWYASNPFKRTGYYVNLADKSGKFAALGIASDRILLQTLDQNWSDQTYLMDTTNAFHTYRLAFSGSTVAVFVDGRQVLSDTVGSGATPNQVIFGDVSILGASTSLTKSIVVEGLPDCVVADLDCDGDVDGSDLGVLLGAWGTDACEADLNKDGTVDGIDLGTMLGLWGA
ncbi:MAG: hypothetical protein JNM94_08980 [Phycisphaerae bacterium]|nr:hypothetical protein [Phycisphaerae bacterium]